MVDFPLPVGPVTSTSPLFFPVSSTTESGTPSAAYNSHIITLEDPIEYLHNHKKSVVNQREIGLDTQGYARALRSALREDPDVILVGEMRDLDTISTAITAAETGHLVFSTLHTIGAANTIDRVIDVLIPRYLKIPNIWKFHPNTVFSQAPQDPAQRSAPAPHLFSASGTRYRCFPAAPATADPHTACKCFGGGCFPAANPIAKRQGARRSL